MAENLVTHEHDPFLCTYSMELETRDLGKKLTELAGREQASKVQALPKPKPYWIQPIEAIEEQEQRDSEAKAFLAKNPGKLLVSR